MLRGIRFLFLDFMRPKSRCNSQLHYFSTNTLTNSPSTEEDDVDELLDCERFSQISGSAITVSGIGDPTRIQHMEQQLADLQKMMAQLLQVQQSKKDLKNTEVIFVTFWMFASIFRWLIVFSIIKNWYAYRGIEVKYFYVS